MRVSPLVLVLVFATSACTMTSGQKRGGYIAGAVITLSGAALLGVNHSGSCDTVECVAGSFYLEGAGLALAGVGLGVLMGVAMSGTAQEPSPQPLPPLASSDAPPPAAQPAPEVAPATSDPVLLELTRDAVIAARAGRCKSVQAIADRVSRIDRAYRIGAFMDDRAIAACID